MAITIQIKKDGEVKKFSRPNTNVLEMEEFYDLQERVIQYASTEKNPTKTKIQDMQLEFVVDLFKDEDITVMDLKLGIDSKELGKFLRDVFIQIAPEEFKEEGKSKA